MTENSDLEKRLSDLERRHDRTRECLIDALALAAALLMAGAFNDYYKPASGIYTYIVVFAICYRAATRLNRWLMKDENEWAGWARPAKPPASAPRKAAPAAVMELVGYAHTPCPLRRLRPRAREPTLRAIDRFSR